ncbi:tail fiber protein, partial [Escherichia coli]|nr:tail fiber protein [Escherichia coli]
MSRVQALTRIDKNSPQFKALREQALKLGSETQAATPKAVKAAYDLANGKYTAQDATTARKGLVQLSSATN